MNQEDLNDKQAVALYYDGKHAPTITAKGSGELAEQILAVAAEHGILLHEDPELLQALACLELGDEIPEAVYITIAKLIAFAYYLNGKVPNGS